MRPGGAARRGALLGLGLLLLAGVARAEPTFPPLKGRVVDGAELLPPDAERRIAARLEAHERATTNQVVVVTLDSLQGYPIEDFGYQLGRHWGIGQKGADNGALLIVVPSEREMRIEVGYGLEGTLTDALSAHIVHDVVLPRFRRGAFEEGIEAGVTAMIEVLGGEYERPPPRQRERHRELPVPIVAIFGLFLLLTFLRGMGGGRGAFLGPGFAGRSFGGGGFGGGGFGGGGGSFGGGGASGGW